MRVVASAPGKVVITGEYAVLHGAPALVAATRRRAHVRLQRASGTLSSLSAPQLGLRRHVFEVCAGRLQHRTAVDAATEEAMRVVVAVLEEAAVHQTLPALDVLVDTRELHVEGRKLGLGSSAAVAVALYVALVRLGGRAASHAELLIEIVAAHRRAQGGRGSGLDVAASLLGGVVTYQLDGTLPRAERLSLPANMHLVALATGVPASTPAFLASVEQLAVRDPRRHAELMRRLEASARRAQARLTSGDVAALGCEVASYGDLLEELGAAAGLDIFSAAHRRLAQLVGQAGGVYKPSGAGGGDVGVALMPSAEALAHLRASLRGQSIEEVALALDGPGAQVTVEC